MASSAVSKPHHPVTRETRRYHEGSGNGGEHDIAQIKRPGSEQGGQCRYETKEAQDPKWEQRVCSRCYCFHDLGRHQQEADQVQSVRDQIAIPLHASAPNIAQTPISHGRGDRRHGPCRNTIFGTGRSPRLPVGLRRHHHVTVAAGAAPVELGERHIAAAAVDERLQISVALLLARSARQQHAHVARGSVVRGVGRPASSGLALTGRRSPPSPAPDAPADGISCSASRRAAPAPSTSAAHGRRCTMCLAAAAGRCPPSWADAVGQKVRAGRAVIGSEPKETSRFATIRQR